MIYIIFIVFFSILSSSLCVRPYTIRLVSYTSEYKNEFFQALTFKLLNYSEVLVFNGSVILNRDLDKIDLAIKVMANDNNKRGPWKLLNITIDLCEFIRGEGKYSLNLLNNVLKNVKSFDHLIPDHCPVKKGIEYYCKNFKVVEDLYPPRLPKLSLNAFISISDKNERFYKGNFGLVIADKNTSLNGIKG